MGHNNSQKRLEKAENGNFGRSQQYHDYYDNMKLLKYYIGQISFCLDL